MSFEDRIRYAKILLRELKNGPLRWSQLSKIMIIHYGTQQKFVLLMKWMTRKGYIVKMGPPQSRAPYRFNPDKVEYDEEGNAVMKFS